MSNDIKFDPMTGEPIKQAAEETVQETAAAAEEAVEAAPAAAEPPKGIMSRANKSKTIKKAYPIAQGYAWIMRRYHYRTISRYDESSV